MQEQQAITIASGKPFPLAAAHASAATHITSHTKNLVLNKLPCMFQHSPSYLGITAAMASGKAMNFELMRGEGIRGHL